MGFGVREPGTRVGAILSAKAGVEVRLLGYGVFKGSLVPPRPIGLTAMIAPEEARVSWEAYWEWYRQDADPEVTLEQIQLPNPCITLDSGVEIWGAECHWGDEDVIRRKIEKADCEVIDVDPRTVETMLAYEGD
jgi:hypothetical protein